MKPIKKYILFTLSCLLISPISIFGQQTNSQNYILSRTYKQAGANANDVSKVVTHVQYIDGLGRPMQSVTVGQSPAGTDVVIPITYDALGRQTKHYLPYVASGNGSYKSNGIADVATWYLANSAALQKTNVAFQDLERPFQETVFEPNPLNRPSTEQAPGGRSRASSISYGINTEGELKQYDYDPASNTISTPGNYAAGMLKRTTFLDEQGFESNEYTDLEGHVVCKSVLAESSTTLYTYYVYDDLGLLRAVLQPNFQDDASFTNSAFLYEYDPRGKVIKKQVPGAGTTEIVYDAYDRPVYSRDANQLARGVWGFTKYDALNRPIVTGEIASTATWATLTSSASSAQHHENRSTSVVEGYTLDRTEPTTTTEANLLTIVFYDDYEFTQPSGFAYAAETGFPASAHTTVKSLATGGRVRMLPGDGSTGGWLTNVTYYDEEYRPIQTVRELHGLGSGATERISTLYKYDLAPVIARQKTVQTIGGVTHSHSLENTYDHADRLLGVKETVTSGTKTKTAFTLAQRYNTLGQLQSKWFHAYPDNELNYRRRTDYTHNVRGWLTGAKTWYQYYIGSDLAFYAFDLSYGNVLNAAQYSNGNISKMEWMGKDETAFSGGLSFTYDQANRLLASGKPAAATYTYSDTESGITYDKNGNIKTLIRAGAATDELTYSYVGNRLTAINDVAASSTGVKNGASSYDYDANGNMISDGNRGATLSYNFLNLPKTVTFGGKTFQYDYDASGNKHSYKGDTVNIKYAGRFEYDGNNVLKRVATSEGQLVPSGDTLRFDYYLKDHLGNVRVVWDESGTILQKNDYYPFGLEIDRNSPVQMEAVRNGVNRYLFNGIEKQPETGIYLARFRGLDPTIGRWMQMDPKPDQSMSLYAAMNNNPIRFTDPLGDTSIVNNRGIILKQYGGDNIIYQQGKKGKLTHIGEFGKSVDLSRILPNIMKDNKKAAKVMGVLGFANAVRPGGKWDYKDANAQKGNIFGAVAKYEDATRNITSFTSGKLNFIEGGADVGNYNYGYTGRYVGGDGFSPLTLWGAAGVLQTGKDFLQGKLGKAFSEFGSMAPMVHPPLGDETDDFIWTTTGMIHADHEKKNNN